MAPCGCEDGSLLESESTLASTWLRTGVRRGVHYGSLAFGIGFGLRFRNGGGQEEEGGKGTGLAVSLGWGRERLFRRGRASRG